MQYIMVLNDGETFTNLEGCAILAVPDGLDTDQIETIMEMDSDQGMKFPQVASFSERAGLPFLVIESLAWNMERATNLLDHRNKMAAELVAEMFPPIEPD